MYSQDQQLSSQSDVYAPQTMQPTPVQAAPMVVVQQPQPKPSTCQLCKNCFTSKPMKIGIMISVFVMCPVLMVMIGGFCPYFLITMKIKNMFPPFLFSIYTFIFALVLILVEFKIKFIGKIFLFLLSPTYRALFMIFLGTLAMAAYESVPTKEWIGYFIGSVTIIVGIFHIIVGCMDKEWKKQQVQKYQDQPAQQPYDPSQVQINQAQPMAATQYPSLAGDAGMGYSQPPPQQYPPQQYPNPQLTQTTTTQVQPVDNKQLLLSETAKMPETQQFVKQAAIVAGGAMINGASTDQAASAAMHNEQVQQLAADAAIAAVKNPQVRSAAAGAASQAASQAVANAYDKLFEDE
ncbi:putative COPI associated protein [Monocercomonoides exilis]|uniref:putative COPI associated protein n=1 Tax=Monocercomonoides exilis TaxID=2049356 RepID=UPI00355A078A|nr:putative COPI associated protein [Monocercomonoides exilis]|eukprot:MONOS_3308.1-p1 / transcript=MONOS_3308.1 / gene=MONOS_3308 / organism=Monocercomonoides_exilis_PA203 / gene_product=unspecified product / transcript_product=unspecified product / location=Mono_scaffold00077:18675-19956(-) / protein_length=348 / sequence_SO=supercontig / SO=protein_coding / is_pseudo=false